MTLKRFTVSILAALLIGPPIMGQTTALSQSPKETKSPKEDKELEKKAFVLLDEVVGEGMSLKLVENRIFILTKAADLIWNRDEGHARGFLTEAVNQFMAIASPVKRDAQTDAQSKDELNRSEVIREVTARMELRTQLLQILAAHDSRMALDFLRASRIPDQDKLLSAMGASSDFEQDFEMQLAVEIAENDPHSAMQIAEDSLKQGVSRQVYEIWANLLNKDPQAAAKLSGDIISAIKSSDPLKDYQSIYVVSSMLEQLRSQIQPSGSGAQPPPQESQGMYRDLLDLMVSTTLKITTTQLLDFQEQGRTRDLLTQTQMFLPDIEKYLPARAQAVRAKLSQFNKAFYPQRSLQDVSQDMENKSPEELIAMAAQAQDEFKGMLYRQAASTFIEQGDTNRARQIMKELVPDDGSWDPIITEIERKEREQAMKAGKLEEARKSLSRLGSNEERVMALVELAAKAEAAGDQTSQRELLKEAGELLGDQMETRSQVEAQLGLAIASLNPNPEKSFEILGSAIDRLNTIMNAVSTITKFDQGTASFSANGAAMEGELLLNAGEYSTIVTNLDLELLAFAKKDFGRTAELLKRWDVNEIRIAISLSLINRILGDEKIQNQAAKRT